MSLPIIALFTGLVLIVAYRTYGSVLARLLRLSDANITPAVAMRDDNDFLPIEPKFLLGQHFSAIAAAGPIVGPIIAGLMFGWGPALVWIILGSILIGGVHDFTALVASIRHRARTIPEVVREHVSPRAFVLFLVFIWLTLVYIIVAFTDITSAAFVGSQALENGQVVKGGGIATSSLLYLLLPVAMGLLLRFTKLSLSAATIIFVPLVVGAIWVGQMIPMDVEGWLNLSGPDAQKVWDVVILGYCVLAAVAPMWLLLQPRGHLGGYFLYFFLIVGGLGMLLGGRPIEYPAFLGWTSEKGDTLAPILFITIACGAVSGFHALIASGTTSKQLARESQAKIVGYGTMLMEAGVAVLALSCVMVLAKGDPLAGQSPNLVFAFGIGSILEKVGIPAVLAISLMLMAFTTFVYDTLDVCTRLGRYIVQELTGWQDRKGAWIGTMLTAGVPLFFVMQKSLDAAGKPIPAWRTFWSLFGASNQLLAALTLLGITVWLVRTRQAHWPFFVTGLPAAFMYGMSCWALVGLVSKAQVAAVAWVGVILLVLAAWMAVEAILAVFRPSPVEPLSATP